MKRLYIQIYLMVIGSLLLVVLAAGLMWRVAATSSPAGSAFDFAGELAAAVLPPASEPVEAQRSAVEKFADALKSDISLFDARRALIASAGRPLPPPQDWRESGGWMHVPGGHAWSIELPDGRWIVMRGPPRRHVRHPAFGLVGFIGAIALAVGVSVYPLVRRVTRRLERLQDGVVSLGAGDLKTRVDVAGNDEVAALASSFNRAAERIEALVGAHKMLLANASHELRTPLARIRLGIELLKNAPDPVREADLERDIAELDGLIDEILLSSRLDAIEELDVRETVDLLGLAAEECARYEACQLDGHPVNVAGDPKLLRRLIRNLIDNAERHGQPPVEVGVTRTRTGATARAEITVRDHGPALEAKDREVIFQPFRRAGSGSANSGGTGLGLALVRQIARRHGGDAYCEPAMGGGNTFRIDLPSVG